MAGAAPVAANTNAAGSMAVRGGCPRCQQGGHGESEEENLAHHLGRCRDASAVRARQEYAEAVLSAGRRYVSESWTDEEVALMMADIDAPDIAGGGQSVARHTARYLWNLYANAFGIVCPQVANAVPRGTRKRRRAGTAEPRQAERDSGVATL